MSAIYTVITMQANSLLGCMSYTKGHSAEQSYADCIAKAQFTAVILLRDGVIIKTNGRQQNDYDATNPAFAGDASFMTEAERRANAAEAKLLDRDKQHHAVTRAFTAEELARNLATAQGKNHVSGNAELDAGVPNHFDPNKRGFSPK